jgi:fructoselysine/glucoselysine PTS system EIIC component
MSLFQALLGAAIVGLAYIARRIAGDPQLERPIILGPVIGLILGDLHSGIIVGGTLELIFIGAAPFGGTAPPNVAVATAVGTAFAVESHHGVQGALLAAIPAAVAGTLFEVFAKTACSFLLHPADAAAETASGSRIMGIIWIANAVHFLAYAVPTFLALYFGSGAVNSLSHLLGGDIGNGLNAAAAILPAVGFGILLSALYTKKLFPIFVIGFLFAAYGKFTVIGVGLLATALVLVIMSQTRSTAQNS